MWPSTPHLTKRRKVEEIITHPLRYYVGDRNHPRNSIDSGSKLSPCLRAPPPGFEPGSPGLLLSYVGLLMGSSICHDVINGRERCCRQQIEIGRVLSWYRNYLTSGGAHLLACVLALHMYSHAVYMQSRYSAACDALLLTPLKAGDLHPVMHFSREQLSTGNVVRCFSGLCCDMHSWSSTHCWLVTAVSCCRMHSLAFLVTLAVL